MPNRLCPTCEYEWDSATLYTGKDLDVKCPKCGAKVPGDSMAKED